MGRRKLNKVNLSRYKVREETPDKLERIALSMGYKHGQTAAMGEFLDMLSDINPDLIALIGKKKQNNSAIAQNIRTHNIIKEETATTENL
jgi:hypothetical protein